MTGSKLFGAFVGALLLTAFSQVSWPEVGPDGIVLYGNVLSSLNRAEAQSSGQSNDQSGGAIKLKASRVEANSNTGVVTAIGNVRIDYPSRQIFATSAQAQYYSREQRIVLSGNVDVVQEGNTLQAETVTYLIDEGRFVATPGAQNQVEAVYILPEDPDPEPTLELSPTTPAPLSIPAVPDELPAELGPINRP
ncbi:MAG: LptA/OstA family protein [Cyanobacteria bacterium P01_F01_bin.53]